MGGRKIEVDEGEIRFGVRDGDGLEFCVSVCSWEESTGVSGDVCELNAGVDECQKAATLGIMPV